MKSKIFNCVLSGLALLAAGLVTSASGAAMPGVIEGQAVVMVVTGNATATDGAGAPAQLRNGQILKAGTTVNTQPGSTVVLDLGDNGNALEIKPDSTLTIDTLLKKQVGQEKTFTTELDVKKGSVVGNVKKLSRASTYDVKTANGVAGIRGTSFHIFAVGIFRCANGLLLVRVTDLTKPLGDANRTVTITVPAGREVVVPPQAAPTPNAPAPAPRVTPRPVLIEQALVIAMVNEANTIGVIVNLPVNLPPGTPGVAPEQRQQVNQAIADAVNRLLNAGANIQANLRTGNVLAFENYLQGQASTLALSVADMAAKVDAGVVAYERVTAGAISEQQAALIGQAVFDHFVVGSSATVVDALVNVEIGNHKGFTLGQTLNLNQIAAEKAFATRVAHDISDLRIQANDPRLSALIDAAGRTFLAARSQGLEQNVAYAAARAVLAALQANANLSFSSQLVARAIQGQIDNERAGNQLPNVAQLLPGNLPANLNTVPVSPIQ